jgi:hypothetical protein
MSLLRTRWAAVGAAVAVALGAGGIGLVSATSPADAVTFVPITACRVLDTRLDPDFNVGPKTTPLGPGETHTVAAADGECDGKVPSSATALSLNVTTVDATQLTFLTVWESGQPQPNASSLNPAPGQPPTPNAVTTGIDGSGEFDIYNFQGTVHTIADINGYYVDHRHDDRYYTKAQIDARISTLTGGDIVDGSLTLTDLAGATTFTRTISSPVDVPGGACQSLGGGNSGSQEIGKLAVFTLADAAGNPVIPNGGTAVPSVVIGTSQGGAIIQFLVCNGRTSPFTVPVGAVVTYRLVVP